MSIKPYSESCDQNRDPILEVLQRVFAQSQSVLEIGSGTGQHAAYFPRFLTHLKWQPSDVLSNLPGIEAWRLEAALENVFPGISLDVNQAEWGLQQAVDAVFSANTTHIMDWPSVESMLRGIGRHLAGTGVFCLYGPFNYHGRHSSESNARFDLFLRQRDPASGIRDLDDLLPVAENNGLRLIEDVEMPVNNRCLIFRKLGD